MWSVGSLELHWGESQLARLASVSFTIVSFTIVQSAPALVSALLLYNCSTVSYKSMLLSKVQKYNELRIWKWPVEKFKVATTSIKAVKCSNAIFRLPAWLHPAKFGLYFPSSSSSLYTCKIFISTTLYILVSSRYCHYYILEKKSVPYKKKEVMLLYNQEGARI